MSNRDRNNRKSGISDPNRHNKYHTNKWKNNWGRNFNNYGNSNYRNTDYGSGHSDNRYNNWNQTLPNPWDTDWFNNQQHPNFTNSHYSANNFNITSGIGANYSRTNRVKNLKEKPDRTGDRNFTAKSQSEPSNHPPVVDKIPKKNVKSNKDTPSTVTSSTSSINNTSTNQPCTSSSVVEKVANSVEKLADSPSKQNENSAEQVTKKLIHQLTSMNKHNLKQMINNPSSKYETALQTHARNRMRAEMRTKLQNMSSNQENQLVNNVLDTEESVDMDKIPDNVFDEIGRVLDINLLGQEDNSNKKYNDNDSDDKDKEQIAYPEDLFLRAEKLLMENSILFLEDRLNDSMLNNDRLDDDRTPVKIKNEIKEEPDEIGDDNFFEIQESGNDTFLLSDLVFEDRESSMSLRNDSFSDQLNEIVDKDETALENHEIHSEPDDMVQSPAVAVIVKQEISDEDRYKQTTNNNEDISSNSCSKNATEPSTILYKSPADKPRSAQCSSSTNNHKTITSDDFRTLLANVKQEFNQDVDANIHPDKIINPVAIYAASQEQLPKKNDLFTKLQNSGAFESTSVKRRADTKLDATDYKRDSLRSSRKKKKKHKSRSRSISRLRSRSRSVSRSRNSYRSKKSSRDRSRKRDSSQYSVVSDSLDSRSKVANIELSNDSSINPFDQHDGTSNKFIENVKSVDNLDKTDPPNQPIQVVCTDELAITNTTETHLDDEASIFEEIATESILDNQNESQSIESAPLTDVANLNEGIDNNTNDSSTMKNDSREIELSIADLATEEVTEMVQIGFMETVKEAAAENVTETVAEIVAETVAETFAETVEEEVPPVTVTEKVEDIVPELVKEKILETDTEKTKEINLESIKGINTTPVSPTASHEILIDEKDDVNKLPKPNTEIATELIGDESTSIGSNSIENSIQMTSESQSSTADDATDFVSIKSNLLQKNNIVAIRKIVLKPSSSRHQKSSSKHKCEKERHASSGHKTKKSDTPNSQSSKKSDQKDNSTKHSHNEQPHRVWRSAGEKKCIEPSKSTLRSIDIFDPSRPIEPIKVVEPVKVVEGKSSSRSTEPLKVVEPVKVEAKSSSRSIEPLKVVEPAKVVEGKLPSRFTEPLKVVEPVKVELKSSSRSIEPLKVVESGKVVEGKSSSRSTESLKVVEPVKVVEPKSSSRSNETLKMVESIKIEPKSSSPRKERGKSQSQIGVKASATVPQPRIEPKKSSTPIKKGNTIAIKEKISPLHRHQPTEDSNNKSTSLVTETTTATTTTTVVNHVTPLLSDLLNIMTDNLQRMKDIDLKIMEMQVKKTVIDEQIDNLHKEKSAIDQTTMELQNERFLLLSSLLTNSAIGSQEKMSELPPPPEKIVEPKVVELSSDEEVVIVEKPKKMSSKTKSNVPHNSKRKIDEDAKADGVDGTKCKKLKINLNPLKSLTNNKNDIKNYVDVDEVQSDLKTKEMINATRRCTVRLTKLSSKKIKLLIGKADIIESDDVNSRLKNDVNNFHKMIFDGSFCGHRLPIVHLQVIDGFLIAASEDSNLYMHDLVTGKLLGTFKEHTKTVTNFVATENNNLYSVSLDGCLKKLSLKKFDEQLLSVNVGEALQVMDYSWDTAFIGSRSGKIYIFDTKTDTLSEECLCSVGKSIMALKATKEGPRKILIASSRCHNISVRDAISGLLLRTIEVPDKLTIYSILLDGGQLYCGTNKNLVFRYEFTSGVEISRIKLGTGTICLKSYKNSLILGGCYDGYIYAYDTKNEIQLSRFPGPGKMLLHFDVFKDNIIAAAKDKSLCVLEVPHDIVSHE